MIVRSMGCIGRCNLSLALTKLLLELGAQSSFRSTSEHLSIPPDSRTKFGKFMIRVANEEDNYRCLNTAERL